MIKEYLITDKAPKKDELIETYKKILSTDFESICIPCSLLDAVKIFDPRYISAQIDYPYGLAFTKAKMREVQYADRFGCKNIDVVINHYYLENLLESKLSSEIDSIKKIAKKSNVRLVVDYRLFDSLRINFFGGICNKLGIDTVIIGTGNFVEDPIDNIIMAKNLEKKFNLYCVTTGVIRNKDDFNALKEYELFGVRVCSLSIFNLILGV